MQCGSTLLFDHKEPPITKIGTFNCHLIADARDSNPDQYLNAFLRNTYISSSGSFLRASLAIHWKAASTLKPSFAEVSK
jgi:hypothetical protein